MAADKVDIRSLIRTIPDYPKPGILFRDITTLMADPAGLRAAIDGLVLPFLTVGIDYVAGIEARGFILGGAVAHELGRGFVPIRKKGKLPFRCAEVAYALEYGEAVVEMHVDAVRSGERVVLVDDLLATGGTAGAAIRLIEKFGGQVAGAIFLIELGFLKGRALLGTTPISALLTF